MNIMLLIWERGTNSKEGDKKGGRRICMSRINHKRKQGQYSSKLCNSEADLKCADCIYWCQWPPIDSTLNEAQAKPSSSLSPCTYFLVFSFFPLPSFFLCVPFVNVFMFSSNPQHSHLFACTSFCSFILTQTRIFLVRHSHISLLVPVSPDLSFLCTIFHALLLRSFLFIRLHHHFVFHFPPLFAFIEYIFPNINFSHSNKIIVIVTKLYRKHGHDDAKSAKHFILYIAHTSQRL